MSQDIVKRNTFAYYTTQIFHSLIFTIPIWIVYYQARISVAQISFLVTFQYIMQMVMELPSGALADLIGRRSSMILCYLVGAAGYLFLPLATQFWHFVLLSFLVGLSDSFRSGAEEAIVYDTFVQARNEKQVAKVYANGNMIYQAGLIISTALGGLLFEYNQSLPYILYGSSLLLGTAFAAMYKEPKIDSEIFTLKNYLKQIHQGTREAFKNTPTAYLSLYYIFVSGIAWSSTLYFNGFMMIELGFSDSLRGFLTAAMRFLNVIIISSLLKNEKIFNRTRTILFFPIIMLLGYLPGFAVDSYWGLPFVQMAMIATTARWILLSPLTNTLFSSKYRATAISVLSLFIGFVYVGMTGISGLIIPQFGIKMMYTFMGLITFLTVVPLTYKVLHNSEH